jgi:hypothetical protein
MIPNGPATTSPRSMRQAPVVAAGVAAVWLVVANPSAITSPTIRYATASSTPSRVAHDSLQVAEPQSLPPPIENYNEEELYAAIGSSIEAGDEARISRLLADLARRETATLRAIHATHEREREELKASTDKIFADLDAILEQIA